MKNLIKIAGVAVMVLAPMQVNAAKTGSTGNVPFGGQVDTSCTITLGTAGTLAASADFLTLSSAVADGGAAGTAQVVTNGNTFTLSTDTPVLSGANPTTADSTSSTMTSTGGTTSFTGVAENTATALNRGATQVNVDMTAAAAGGFSEGVYAATVLLTCE